MGRRKIDIELVKDPSTRQITFSKRRKGLFKKANELSFLCNAELVVVVFSPGNKPYTYGHPGVDVVATKFLNQQDNPNETKSGSSSKVANVNKINKQLGNLTKQVSKEENKRAMLDKTAKEITSSEKLSELKRAYAMFAKLKKSIDAHVRDVETAETLIEFSKKPIDGVKCRVSRKNQKLM
ncbi:hypothetical protein RJT34_03802 [Clitoria ternatea]|uniref:MADS-box domain-containing protein n=1 Tax=Clitoria ternatea TaxID=43366 RepID=A0AAN9KNM9_CLITE